MADRSNSERLRGFYDRWTFAILESLLRLKIDGAVATATTSSTATSVSITTKLKITSTTLRTTREHQSKILNYEGG